MLSLRIEQQQLCGLCEQNIAGEQDIDSFLCGAKKYYYCPICGNSTKNISQDPIWQLQVDLLEENRSAKQ